VVHRFLSAVLLLPTIPSGKHTTTWPTFPVLRMFWLPVHGPSGASFLLGMSDTPTFGGVYVTGFCLRFDYLGRRFVRTGGDAYNYTRTEKRPDEAT
jgi:hypothetical protein